MKIRSLLLLAVLLLPSAGCAGTTYLRPSQGDLTHVSRLAVVVLGEPDFKVLQSRATDLGPGILFGAVGALANSAYTNSRDSKQEGELESQTARILCRESFQTQLKKLLEGSKKFESVDFYDQSGKAGMKGRSFDAVLELSIQEWGIKVVDEESTGLVPFITVEIRLTDPKGKVLWKERDVEVGRSDHSIEEYRSRENLLKDSLQAVLDDTAYRITSTLIYS